MKDAPVGTAGSSHELTLLRKECNSAALAFNFIFRRFSEQIHFCRCAPSAFLPRWGPYADGLGTVFAP
ncbi:hypothetical protein [Microvirga sp. M2]|uniref:hypothetical protein n=1 Tax=Microvirga sp. M2 TaxID=3073270 RepID=UPI0039C3E2B0